MNVKWEWRWGGGGVCFHRTVGGKAENWSPAGRSLAPLWTNQASSGRAVETSREIITLCLQEKT